MTAPLAALRAWAAGWGGDAGEAAVTGAADRAATSAAGRRAATAALGALGGPPLGPARHADGRPVWPAGWTGSISHDRGLAVAVVVPAAAGATVGVDVETGSALPLTDAVVVLAPDEVAWCAAQPAPHAAATLLWSAKEAAFKAWNEAAGGALPTVDPQRHLTVAVDDAGGVVVHPAEELADALAAVVSGPAVGRAWAWPDRVLVALRATLTPAAAAP